jgi:hypothetical protein
MSESHLSEVEKTLLYISEARERAGRARAALDSAGAEPHLIAALKATEEALADDHRKLMQTHPFSPSRAATESASPSRTHLHQVAPLHEQRLPRCRSGRREPIRLVSNGLKG